MLRLLLHLHPVVFTLIITAVTTLLLIIGMVIRRRFFSHLYFPAEDNQIANILMRQIGTLLSVLLAFALISTWQDYELQRKNTGEEVSTMGNLYRDSRGLAPEKENQAQQLLVAYTSAIVQDAWPKMKDFRESTLAWETFNKLYGTVIRFSPENEREKIVLTRMIQHLNDLAKYRRLRHLRNLEPLIPTALWVFIIVSTLLTALSGYFLKAENSKLQVLLTLFLGLFLGLIYSMLLLLNYPFAGGLQISVLPIEKLLTDVYPLADLTTN